MVTFVSEINLLEVVSLEIRALSNGATSRAPPFLHSARRRSKDSLRNGFFLICNDGHCTDLRSRVFIIQLISQDTDGKDIQSVFYIPSVWA